MTFQVDFRTKHHANCTAWVHVETKDAALAWVRKNHADKIGPNSKLRVTLVIDTNENHGR